MNTTSDTAELPVRIYTPESPVRHPGRFIREMFRDLMACRELAWRLFVRDLSATYRQSVLGYLWAFVPPLVTALPWLFLSSQKLLNTGDTPVPYPLYVLAGTTLWSAFVEAINCPINALNGGRSMMSKINFPREALIVSSLAQILVNLAMRLAIVGFMLVLFKVPLTSHLLLAPVGVAAVLISGLSLGLIIAPVGMLYGDVARAVTLGSMFWMILTPIVYIAPSTGLAGWLARWNPASPLILTARDWLTSQAPTQLVPFLCLTGGAVILAFLGWALLRLTLPMIVERMGG
jgi:lipopolysaccharide transport system permease protein